MPAQAPAPRHPTLVPALAEEPHRQATELHRTAKAVWIAILLATQLAWLCCLAYALALAWQRLFA
jgi:hypothetical protein